MVTPVPNKHLTIWVINAKGSLRNHEDRDFEMGTVTDKNGKFQFEYKELDVNGRSSFILSEPSMEIEGIPINQCFELDLIYGKGYLAKYTLDFDLNWKKGDTLFYTNDPHRWDVNDTLVYSSYLRKVDSTFCVIVDGGIYPGYTARMFWSFGIYNFTYRLSNFQKEINYDILKRYSDYVHTTGSPRIVPLQLIKLHFITEEYL